MAGVVGRNDPCPCGSGRKYKTCHLGKEHEIPGYEPPKTSSGAASAAARAAAAAPPRTPTWKIVVASIVSLAIVGGGLWFMGFERLGQVIAGVGTLLAIIWGAFRAPPPRREDAGNAESINFGM